MESDWCLSDKRVCPKCDNNNCMGGRSKVYHEEDVKEFIKKLKEECDKNDGYVDIDFINKLAGEKLI